MAVFISKTRISKTFFGTLKTGSEKEILQT